MAKIWLVYEGRGPTWGEAAYELPAREAVERLGVRREDFISDLAEPPHFNEQSALGTVGGYKHVVLELERTDAAEIGWKAGFYLVPSDPQGVIAILGQPRKPMPNDGEGISGEEANRR